MRQSRRWWTAATLGVMLVAAQLVLAAPASADHPVGELGIVEVSEQTSTNSDSPKGVTAWCPDNKVVLGGGAWVVALRPEDDRELMMTAARPIRVSGRTGYNVSGREVAGGFDGLWGVVAYALCGDMPAGYQIRTDSVARSSTPVKEAAAVCLDGELVIGTGALINSSNGEVSLQTARSSGPRDIARAVAKEDANGYAGTWTLTAYAICADPRSGITVQYGGPEQTGPQDVKIESVTCPQGTVLYNVGAATSGSPPGLLTTPPGVAILATQPTGSNSAAALAVETSPSSASWDLVVQAICGP
jgi:hypothetical protein